MKSYEETIDQISKILEKQPEVIQKMLLALQMASPNATIENIFYAYCSGWFHVDPKHGGGWALDSSGGRIHFPEVPSMEQIYNINKDIDVYSKNLKLAPNDSFITLKEKSSLILPN